MLFLHLQAYTPKYFAVKDWFKGNGIDFKCYSQYDVFRDKTDESELKVWLNGEEYTFDINVPGFGESVLAFGKEHDLVDELLAPTSKRFVLFPIRHEDIWEFYKKSEACFWTAEEIDLAQDYNDWTEKLNDDERFFLKHILCFFAASDGIVNENLCENLRWSAQIRRCDSSMGSRLRWKIYTAKRTDCS